MTQAHPMLTEDRLREVLAELSRMGSRLSELFEDLSHWERLWKPDAASWSCMGHLGHILDVELVYSVRIRSALAEPGRKHEPFDSTAWVDSQCSLERTPEDIIEMVSLLRRWNMSLLCMLTALQWESSYVHSVRGEESLAQLAQAMLAHDAQHLLELGRISELARQARRVA